MILRDANAPQPERQAGSSAEGPNLSNAGLLEALVSLVASWTSMPVQASVAQRIGLDISVADMRSLHTIGRLGQARPAVLAEELHSTRPTMSKSLARLEQLGLIERREVEADGRSSEIVLSEKGLANYERVVSAGLEMITSALETSNTPAEIVPPLTDFVRVLAGRERPSAPESAEG